MRADVSRQASLSGISLRDTCPLIPEVGRIFGETASVNSPPLGSFTRHLFRGFASYFFVRFALVCVWGGGWGGMGVRVRVSVCV